MTIFNIVAIVLALCGSTFTVINQLSSLFNERIKEHQKQCGEQLHTIVTLLNDTGTQKAVAKGRDKILKFCCRIWNLAGLPPVIVLAIFAFITAFRVMPGDLSKPNSITDGEAHFYGCWLEVVIWTNLISFIAKVVSLIFIKILHRLQEQCYRTAIETNPVGPNITAEGEPNITPEEPHAL